MNNKFTKKGLKKVLKQSFIAPPPKQKEKFMRQLSYPKAKLIDLFISQIGFIRKRVWVLFALCVGYAFFYVEFTNIPENIVTGVSAILPLFSLCIITEIYKSTSYNMEEMELACKYNLAKITIMRLSILGTLSFVMMVLLVMLVGESDYGTLRNAIYVVVPYMLSCYLSLMLISKIRTNETLYVCFATSGSISFFVLIAKTNYSIIYNANFTFFWMIAFFVLLALITLGIISYIKSQEELQWSYV